LHLGQINSWVSNPHLAQKDALLDPFLEDNKKEDKKRIPNFKIKKKRVS